MPEKYQVQIVHLAMCGAIIELVVEMARLTPDNLEAGVKTGLAIAMRSIDNSLISYGAEGHGPVARANMRKGLQPVLRAVEEQARRILGLPEISGSVH